MTVSLRRAPLVDMICERLLSTYRQAEWLPPERTLATELGISRSSLREAIKRLENQGLLESRHGVGVRVTNNPKSPLAQTLLHVLPSPSERIRQFAAVRVLLEPEIAALAAQHVSSADVDALTICQHQLHAAATVDDAVSADLEFHRLLATIAGNQVLALMLSSIAHLAAEARRVSLQRVGLPHAFAQHQRVLDAVAARDPEAARDAMLAHVEAAQSAPPRSRSSSHSRSS